MNEGKSNCSYASNPTPELDLGSNRAIRPARLIAALGMIGKPMDVRNKERLIERVSAGESFDFLYFWGHRPTSNGAITNSCLSQWFVAPFRGDELVYRTAEHYMMARKAELFDQPELAMRIIGVEDPGRAKSLGRTVERFDEDVWVKHRWKIVVDGNVLKFSQNPRLRKYLLSTGEKVLVEASPNDRIWGIGMDAKSPDASSPARWEGENLLGFALMEVRARLSGTAA